VSPPFQGRKNKGRGGLVKETKLWGRLPQATETDYISKKTKKKEEKKKKKEKGRRVKKQKKKVGRPEYAGRTGIDPPETDKKKKARQVCQKTTRKDANFTDVIS